MEEVLNAFLETLNRVTENQQINEIVKTESISTLICGADDYVQQLQSLTRHDIEKLKYFLNQHRIAVVHEAKPILRELISNLNGSVNDTEITAVFAKYKTVFDGLKQKFQNTQNKAVKTLLVRIHDNLMLFARSYEEFRLSANKMPSIVGGNFPPNFVSSTVLLLENAATVFTNLERLFDDPAKIRQYEYSSLNEGEKLLLFIANLPKKTKELIFKFNKHLQLWREIFATQLHMEKTVAKFESEIVRQELEQEDQEITSMIKAKRKKDPKQTADNKPAKEKEIQKPIPKLPPKEKEIARLRSLENISSVTGLNSLENDLNSINNLGHNLTTQERIDIASRLICLVFALKNKIKNIDQLDQVVTTISTLLSLSVNKQNFNDDEKVEAAFLMAELHSIRCEIIHKQLENPQYDLVLLTDGFFATNGLRFKPSNINPEQIKNRKKLLTDYGRAIESLNESVTNLHSVLSNVPVPKNSESLNWSLDLYTRAQKSFFSTIEHHQKQDDLRQAHPDEFRKFITHILETKQKIPQNKNSEARENLQAANEELKNSRINYALLKKTHQNLENGFYELDKILKPKPPTITRPRFKSLDEILDLSHLHEKEITVAVRKEESSNLAILPNGSHYFIQGDVRNGYFITTHDQNKNPIDREVRMSEDGLSAKINMPQSKPRGMTI